MPLRVRLARPEDQPRWEEIWDESARAGFTPLLPEGHEFPSLDPGRWHELHADPAVSMLMAEDESGMLGFTMPGASRDADAGDEVGEVRTMFASRAAWGRGVGDALMTAALDDLRKRGYSEATVWSFADNERANRFYERHGFTRDGAERSEEAWAHILEVRYRRSL
jgi:GNAT superfamily N-acetyltransferase